MHKATTILVGLMVGVASCSGREETADLSTYPSGLEAKEAPMLAHQVAQGKLPPVEERLPANPLVADHSYEGYEGPGVYGGAWHRMDGAADFRSWQMIGGYAPLTRWKFDCSGLAPGLAESWEFNDDGSVLTMHLRKGLRWSDGHPYTSEAFAFYYELCLDERHRLQPPVWCRVNGKPMTVETPDPYTIVMRFAGPNWLVPLWLATGFWGPYEYTPPKHYLSQFHPDYGPRDANGNPKCKDFTEFVHKNLATNPDRPTMWPWRLVRYENAGYRLVFERNPYYYVVDDLGRQLPYIDRVVSSLVPDVQIRALRILAGEVDCQFRLLELKDLALYLEGQERGAYRVLSWRSGGGADPAININWSDKDLVLRGLIRQQAFRKALALGIDRDKCNQIAWRGLLEPQGATISQQAWHFKGPEGQALLEEWRQADAQFDLGKANGLLDAMGLTERDTEGYRLRPDGKRLRLVFDLPTAPTSHNDIGLIVAEGWEQLGIEVVISTPPGAEMLLRRRLGDYTIGMFFESEIDLFTYPEWVFPTRPLYWAPQVGEWYNSGGKKGEAPTGVMKRLLDLYDNIKQEPDVEKRHDYVRKAVRIHIEEGPFNLGTVARGPRLVVVKDHFHNVPATGVLGPWAIVHPGSSFPEQYFIDEEPG